MADNKTFMDFLNKKDREVLIAESVVLKLAKNDYILKEGEINKTIYTVVAGEVSVSSNIAGHEIELHRLGPGEVIGEMSFIDNKPASADVCACSDTTVNSIGIDAIAQYILVDPFFYGRFYKALSRTLSYRLRTGGEQTKKRISNWNVLELGD